MSKKVISFRLSDREIETLDEACRRFNRNRSEIVNLAIEMLGREYVLENGELVKRTPWLLSPLKEE